MKRLIVGWLVPLLVTAALGLVAFTAQPSRASWVSSHCSSNHTNDDIVQRKSAQSYAAVAVNEGYEWGGGCWNDNNKDDTPGAPDSGGEGPDCSGLVFKAWELKTSGSGGTAWDKLENVHGPYASSDFHSPVGSDPFGTISKGSSSMQYMDAFAKNGHVALLASKDSGSSNTDYVYEAYSDSSGVLLDTRSYRTDSSYTGVKREGWTADCYPNCGGATPAAVRIP